MIFGYHVSDWVTPNGHPVASRAMTGDGPIDPARLRQLVDAAGYDGPIEVEVINASDRRREAQELLALAIERFRSAVGKSEPSPNHRVLAARMVR